jgi:NADH dehydrogenase
MRRALFRSGALGLGAALGLWLWRTRRQEAAAPPLASQPRVVIVGAGFGGLTAARALVGAPASVLILDQNNYHLFIPLLYQVATASLEPEEIAQPVRGIIKGLANLRFQMARVTGVDLERRQVLTETGAIPYDYLILATGSATNFYGLEHLRPRVQGLKDLPEAVRLRNHILKMFERAVTEPDRERQAALLTFVIVGGGPTGVEFAGALAELIRLVLVHDYPGLDFGLVRIILVEAGSALLGGFPPSLQQAAAQALREKGVEVWLNAPVESYEDHLVRLRDGRTIPAHTLVWAAGVQASDLAVHLGLPTGRAGRIRVTDCLHLPGRPEVYVVGDSAYVEQDGRPLPMVIPVAMQQGAHAARNIRRQLRGLDPLPFRYHDKGAMVTIGRHAAVAHIYGLSFTGFPAWLVWLVFHLLQIISLRNRLLVLINWAWDYFFFERGVRLITAR